ncbi:MULTISPECIES: GAF domain-containing protein [unclassified Leptolyngbya]|uniref:GAF domain-containing protein n=1 Tax=unclassified Leptolyngbya TaxID=2650499 RepID=UPI00168609B8|nr:MULTISPECIES: GAF domain-containing protein [unclassified Leptolyngbya]MBD1910041.1 PAS domain S-box protein [Leptolyngbya sp. FACHB-8]MBD2153058.1 PAS domain S-box protein [Leptolyngbya sp. FACHB-16]
MVSSIDSFQTEPSLVSDTDELLGQDLLAGILQTSAAAITVVDTQGNIVFANDVAEKILGLQKSQVTQRSYNSLGWKVTDFEGHPFPNEELPFVRVMQTGNAVFDIQHAIEWPTGERRYLSINGSPLKDVVGNIHHVVFSVTDITEHIHSQRIQQDALEFYRQSFDSSPTIKLLSDLRTDMIVDANSAAIAFYGYPLEQLRQMKISDINRLPTDLMHGELDHHHSHQPCCCYFPHRLASGEIRQVEVHSSLLHLQGRELLYSIVHDVTDRQRFEDALASQLKQEQLLEEVTQAIRQSLDLKVVLQTTVHQVQEMLGADRVIIYRPTLSGSSGSVLVESCSPTYPPLLGWEIGDVGIEQRRFIQPYQQGQYQAIANISQSNLDPAYVQLLETFHVKSQLVIPILHTSPRSLKNQRLSKGLPRASPVGDLSPSPKSQPEQIWGLLIVHQCAFNHPWQDWEIAMLQRLETQLAVAIQQAELYQQVQKLNTDLEFEVRQRTIQLQRSLGSEAVLRHITDRIHGTLSEQAILQTAVQELGLALNLHTCYASLYNLEQQKATVSYEYADASSSLLGTVISMANYPEVYAPLMEGEYRQFCSQLFHKNSEPMAILCHPIVDDEQGILGDLKLLSWKERVFDEREVQLVQQVAKQCAIAIRQSRLYQSAQTQIRELEKLNRLKDDFLSTTSHELRTPLSSIKMSAQLMDVLLRQNGEPIHPKIERCLNILRDECDREINLINDLLLLQQINAETQPFISSIFHLQDWLPQIIETFEERFKEHQQVCWVEIPPDLPLIVTDLFTFNRVFDELLTNAYKFTPAGEEIIVKAELVESLSQQSRIRLYVTNTGAEIPPHELPHIFEQFYRIPSHDPWKHSGTGLGLALVKRLVQYLDGSINVTSNAKQTCFTVDLPLHTHRP